MKGSLPLFGASTFYRARQAMNLNLTQEIKSPKKTFWNSDSFALLFTSLILASEYLVTTLYFFREKYTLKPYEVPVLTIFCAVSLSLCFIDNRLTAVSSKPMEICFICLKIGYTFLSSFLYITLHLEVLSLYNFHEDAGPVRLIDQTIIFTFLFTLYLNSRNYSTAWLGIISMVIIIIVIFVYDRISNYSTVQGITTMIFAFFVFLIMGLNIFKSCFKQREKLSLEKTQNIIQDLLHNVPVGVVLFNISGKILFFNNESRGIFSGDNSPHSNFEQEFRKKLMRNRLRMTPNKEMLRGMQLKLVERVSSLSIENKEELLEEYAFEQCLNKFIEESAEDFSSPKVLYILELDGFPKEGSGRRGLGAAPSPFRTFKSSPRKLYEVSFVKIVAETNSPFILTTFKDVSQAVSIQEYSQKSDLKNQILSSFSHELKTPLNGSLPLIECAARDKELPLGFKEKYLFQPLRSLKLLSFLINDIIDYLKIDTNQLSFQFERFNLRQLLEEIKELVGSKIPGNNISLSFKFHAGLPEELCTDSLRLKCILANLINNCIKNTAFGEVCLETLSLENDIIFKIYDTRYRNPQSGTRIPLLSVQSQQIRGECNESSREGLQKAIKIGNSPKAKKIKFVKSGSSLSAEKNCQSSLLLSPNFSDISPFSNFNFHQEPHTDLDLDEILMEESSNIYVENEDFQEENELGLYVSRQLAILLGPKDNSGIKLFTKKDMGVLFQFRIHNIQISNQGSPSNKNLQRRTSLRIEGLQEEDRDSLSNVNTPNAQMSSHPGHASHFSSFNNQINFKRSSLPSPKNEEESLTQQVSEGEISDENRLLFQRSILRTQTSEPGPSNNCNCEEVLLVDDEPFNLFSMESILAKLGLRTIKALNGALAVETVLHFYENKRCFSQNCTGLQYIFMDLNMPVMGGLEATKALLLHMEKGTIPQIPIIACTANDSQQDMIECEKAGMKGFLSKPVTISKLEEILDLKFN